MTVTPPARWPSDAERLGCRCRSEHPLLRATALFEADHGSPEQALAAAQAAYDRARSVFAADALAWAPHADGQHQQALAKADEALALGGRPALFLFHRSTIAQALGRDAEAARDLRQALAVNPHFSVPHAKTASTTLERLARLPGRS